MILNLIGADNGTVPCCSSGGRTTIYRGIHFIVWGVTLQLACLAPKISVNLGADQVSSHITCSAIEEWRNAKFMFWFRSWPHRWLSQPLCYSSGGRKQLNRKFIFQVTSWPGQLPYYSSGGWTTTERGTTFLVLELTWPAPMLLVERSNNYWKWNSFFVWAQIWSAPEIPLRFESSPGQLPYYLCSDPSTTEREINFSDWTLTWSVLMFFFRQTKNDWTRNPLTFYLKPLRRW